MYIQSNSLRKTVCPKPFLWSLIVCNGLGDGLVSKMLFMVYAIYMGHVTVYNVASESYSWLIGVQPVCFKVTYSEMLFFSAQL